MSTEYSFSVKGLPQPKGSTRTFVVGGKPVTTSANPRVGEWQRLVAFALQDFPGGPFDGPVIVSLGFSLQRPKWAPKRVKVPAVRPDLDKLVRAVLDAMTGIVFKDDGQVIRLTATKVYADAYSPVGLNGIITTS